MKPKCESCPFWSRSKEIPETGFCHHSSYGLTGFDNAESPPDWWCEIHPDAPKVVTVTIHKDNAGDQCGWDESYTEIQEASDG